VTRTVPRRCPASSSPSGTSPATPVSQRRGWSLIASTFPDRHHARRRRIRFRVRGVAGARGGRPRSARAATQARRTRRKRRRHVEWRLSATNVTRVSSVVRVEMIRDGGSFSATFLDPADVEHRLWFPLTGHGAYGEPFVARVARFVDETSVGWFAQDVRVVTWAEALSLLAAIQSLIPEGDEWSVRWSKQMVGVAQRSGRPEAGR
jgi:hypothetical protein